MTAAHCCGLSSRVINREVNLGLKGLQTHIHATWRRRWAPSANIQAPASNQQAGDPLLSGLILRRFLRISADAET